MGVIVIDILRDIEEQNSHKPEEKEQEEGEQKPPPYRELQKQVISITGEIVPA